MKNRAKILVIDDDPAMLELTKLQLNYSGYDVTTAEGGMIGLKLAEGNEFDLILTDLHMPDLDGIEIVERVKKIKPELEIILISGLGTMSDAIAATKAGAFWFLEKPIDFDRLKALMEKALQHNAQTKEVQQQAAEIQQLRQHFTQRNSYFEIVGSSKLMQEVFELIEGVADSEANVLIIGESGTGKEMIANAIHYRSPRAKQPFIKVNCAALPKELIESELFGHTKGAFTGAAMDKTGLIGQARGGSLLLDEVGEMPLDLQPKLLRVLQERVYTRLGSEKPQEADFRLIAATNRDPQQAIREGLLREDLYYRMNTILVRVPPLRERAEDIQHLVEHFLNLYAVKYRRPARGFSAEAWERLLTYQWPGNVRELQNLLERVVLLSKTEIIEASALPFDHIISAGAPRSNFVSVPPIATAPTAANTAAGLTPPTIPNPAMAGANAAANNANTLTAPSAATPPSLPAHTPPEPSANALSAAMNANLSPPFATQDSTSGRANSATAAGTLDELCEAMIRLVPLPQVGAEQMTFFEQLEAPLVKAALARTNGNKQGAADLLGIYRPRLYNILKRVQTSDNAKD